MSHFLCSPLFIRVSSVTFPIGSFTHPSQIVHNDYCITLILDNLYDIKSLLKGFNYNVKQIGKEMKEYYSEPVNIDF